MTKNKNNKYMGWIVGILVVMLVLGLFFFYNAGSYGEKITYNEITAKISNNEIEAMYAVGNEVRILVKGSEITIEKFKAGKGADFHAELAYDSLKDLRKNVEDYNNLQEKPEGWSRIDHDWLPEPSSFLETLMPILSMTMMIILVVLIFKNLAGMNPKNMSFSKVNARTVMDSKVRFTNVAGSVEEKEEVKEIVDFLKNPKKYNDAGARIPKGVLLVGPPGTGKTLLAKAIAGESNVPFYSISGSDFVEMFVGVGASRVRDLFDQAKRTAPCIIFIDEIDAVGRQRGAGLGGGNDEREQTLNQLLVQMDGFTSNTGIIVIAATNRADVLDPALLRPGRFDRQIYINLPDAGSRKAILELHAKNKKIGTNVSLEDISRLTSGFSGADLENLLNEAAIFAARDGRIVINMTDINEAMNKVMMGPQKKSRKVSERDRRITAYHESGHAILQKCLEFCDEVHEVSIVPRGMAGGYTMTRPDNDDSYYTINKLNDIIAGMMGGRIAEELIFKDFTTGASNDIMQATKTARKMVTEYGMSADLGFMSFGNGGEVFVGRDYASQKEYSEDIASKIDLEVKKILDYNYNRAKKILMDNMDKLEVLATTLLEKNTVYKDEVEMIMNGASKEEVIAKMNEKQEKVNEEARLAKEKREQEEKARLEELKRQTLIALEKQGIKIEKTEEDSKQVVSADSVVEQENLENLVQNDTNEEDNKNSSGKDED